MKIPLYSYCKILLDKGEIPNCTDPTADIDFVEKNSCLFCHSCGSGYILA